MVWSMGIREYNKEIMIGGWESRNNKEIKKEDENQGI